MDKYKDKVVEWAVIGVLTVIIGWLWWSADRYIDERAASVYSNKGIPQETITEIKTTLASIDAHLVAGDKDRAEIRQDIRQMIEILTR